MLPGLHPWTLWVLHGSDKLNLMVQINSIFSARKQTYHPKILKNPW
jgi:hypothetical protein